MVDARVGGVHIASAIADNVVGGEEGLLSGDVREVVAGGNAERLKMAKLSKGPRLQLRLKALGMTKLTCVLDDKMGPDADSVLSKPPDVMHLYGAGLTRIEGCHVNEIMLKPDSPLVAVPDP